MKRIAVLSPHLDDGALSCGEFIRKEIEAGNEVTNISIYTGFSEDGTYSEGAKQYHSMCFLDDDSMLYRKKEDVSACNIMGCKYEHLDMPECLYRKERGEFIYPEIDAIYEVNSLKDYSIIKKLENYLINITEQYDMILVPLGLGGHVDHIIIKDIMSKLAICIKAEVLFYEDVPYLCDMYVDKEAVSIKGMWPTIVDVTQTQWKNKVEAVQQYRSQLHVMWDNKNDMFQQLSEISGMYGGNHRLQFWKIKKKILLISHCMDRSGAPIALMNLAVYLQNAGNDVTFAGFGKDGLVNELMLKGLNHIILDRDRNHEEIDVLLDNEYDVVIINTIVLNDILKECVKHKHKTICWLHESDNELYEEYKLQDDISDVKFFAVSQRVEDTFKKYYNYTVNRFYYYIPQAKHHKKMAIGNITFGMIGGGYQKGEDIFYNAVINIFDKAKNVKVKIVFAELGMKDRWMSMAKDNKVDLYNELTQEEIESFYENIDVLVCPSRCDSLPIVVTQALGYGIPVIVSNQVGQSEWIKTFNAGKVFYIENKEMLAYIMEEYINDKDIIIEQRQNALKVFDQYFSMDSFRKQCYYTLKSISEWFYKM